MSGDPAAVDTAVDGGDGRMEYHDAADFRQSYDDAVDLLAAVRVDDGPATWQVQERTPCLDCLLYSLAEIGWRLGGR